MDSDDSQSASSGNESEVEENVESHRNSRRSRSSSQESDKSSNSSKSAKSAKSSKSGKSSRSGKSRSRSNSSGHRSASSDSDSRSPVNKISSPKSSDSEDEPTGNIRRPQGPASPDNVSLDRPSSVLSGRSSSEATFQEGNLPKGPKSPSSVRNDEDSRSVKSDSSHTSHKSQNSSDSNASSRSRRSRNGREAANLDDGNTSDSSTSTSGSHSNIKRADNQAEEISDGDIDLSDNEKPKEEIKKNEDKSKDLPTNLAHEDLSDVSDLDSNDASDFGESKEFDINEEEESEKTKKPVERNKISYVVEEQLDFEAEDGECAEPEISKEREDSERQNEAPEAGELEDDAKIEQKKVPEELEEGELTDEEDARPEETEPRPVCRFFSRGQCTWGASCRFLHPGVTDKGNYTMFDLVRPVIPGDYNNDRIMYGSRAEPPAIESAWERGLRTAKEMMRKSIKRKEQDIDFEEKKMNLSLAQEELDKENGYYAKAPSPEPRYVTMRHAPHLEYPPPARPPPEEYYSRRQVIYEPEYTPIPRERYRTYREIPPHRPTTEYYNSKHEEEAMTSVSKAKRPKREVIVQRAEERTSRADEWSDPWMRSKSPAGRKRPRKHSYSSGSSYSSSSSSRSSSGSSRSSYRSQSRSSRKKQRTSPHTHRRQVSPSVIVSERKAANERAALMNPPAPKKRPLSPGMVRAVAQNPPPPSSKVDQFGRTRSKLAVAAVAAIARAKGRTRSSRSSSGSSSGSSSSDSDSSGSSSSSSRNASPTPKRTSGVDLALALKAKAIDALKTGSEKKQIKLNLKSTALPKKTDFAELTRKAEASQSRKRPLNLTPSPESKNTAANKKASSRREELLKQLKAVEDAIAKKRSKVN